MKKLFTITMALVAFTISAQNVTFGAKAGLNFASMTGDDADGLDGRTSFHLGVTAEIEISDSFSIQPELLYSGQGFTALNDEDEDYTAKVDYLTLPVMAKFYVADGFSVEVGPQIGFLLSADDNGEDIKELFKSTYFALNLGAGYKLDSGLNFGLRYSMGLTDVPDFDTDDYDFKHSVLQLSVGFNF